MAEPRYSNTWPVPPPTPIWASRARIISLSRHRAVMTLNVDGGFGFLQQTLGGEHVFQPRWCRCQRPARQTPVGGRDCRRRRWSSQVWVSPSSGPITWTIPRFGLCMPRRYQPKSPGVFLHLGDLGRRFDRGWANERGESARYGRWLPPVCGRQTLSPRWRRPEKAWGEVTSWMRWESMSITAGVSGCSALWLSPYLVDDRARM